MRPSQSTMFRIGLVGVFLLVVTVAAGATGAISIDSERTATQQSGPTVAPADTIASCTEITAAGSYELSTNLTANDTCVEIRASNVVFDGNGHTITGQNTTGTARGVFINGSAAERRNVTVRDVTVETMDTGLYQTNVSQAVVTNVTATQNTNHGVVHDDPGTGISRNVTLSVLSRANGGDGIHVVGTSVTEGGTTATTTGVQVRGANASANGNHGIYLTTVERGSINHSTVLANGADGIRVADNDAPDVVFNNTVHNNTDDGIHVRSGSDSVVRRNNVTGVGDSEYAIYSFTGSDVHAINNTVDGTIGVFAGDHFLAARNTIADGPWYGIYLAGQNAVARNNTIDSVAGTALATSGTAGSNATIVDNEILGPVDRVVSSGGVGGHFIANNTATGGLAGIHLFDDQNVVRNNRLRDIDGDALTINDAPTRNVGGQVIEHNRFNSSQGDVVTIEGANDTIVRNNTITRIEGSGTGLSVRNTTNVTVADNEIDAADAGVSGIDVSFPTQTAENASVTLSTNTITDTASGVDLSIASGAPSPKIRVTGTDISSIDGVGFAARATNVAAETWNATVVGNVSISNASTPLRIEEARAATFDGMQIDTERVDVVGMNMTIADANATAAPPDWEGTGNAVAISDIGNVTLDSLGLAYNNTTLPANLPEDTLTLWRHNGTAWAESYPTTVDTDREIARVTEPIVTNGTFQLAGEVLDPPEATLSTPAIGSQWPTATIVAGTNQNISLNVTNAGAITGNFSASFEVVHPNGTIVSQGQQSTRLDPGTSQRLTEGTLTSSLATTVQPYTISVRVTGPVFQTSVQAELLVRPDVTGDGRPAQSTTGDYRLNDVDGDGTFDIFDVQALFTDRDTAAVESNVDLFDFDGDQTVDILDIQALFTRLVG